MAVEVLGAPPRAGNGVSAARPFLMLRRNIAAADLHPASPCVNCMKTPLLIFARPWRASGHADNFIDKARFHGD
jgi:hypothetical protein